MLDRVILCHLTFHFVLGSLFNPKIDKSIRGFKFEKIEIKVDDYSHFFLRDQNSQYFNEDLLRVNASAFRFVLCFKAINYAGASSYVISAK